MFAIWTFNLVLVSLLHFFYMGIAILVGKFHQDVFVSYIYILYMQNSQF